MKAATILKHIKHIIIFCSFFIFACSTDKENRNETASTGIIEKYVSITCPKGDITLTLSPDSSFDMTIMYWDNIAKKQTGHESINGRWYKIKDSVLNLVTSDKYKIDYQLSKTKLEIKGCKGEVPT